LNPHEVSHCSSIIRSTGLPAFLRDISRDLLGSTLENSSGDMEHFDTGYEFDIEKGV
jgi:hypothetical protein